MGLLGQHSQFINLSDQYFGNDSVYALGSLSSERDFEF